MYKKPTHEPLYQEVRAEKGSLGRIAKKVFKRCRRCRGRGYLICSRGEGLDFPYYTATIRCFECNHKTHEYISVADSVKTDYESISKRHVIKAAKKEWKQGRQFGVF